MVKKNSTGLIYMGLHNEKLHAFFDKFGLPVADVQSMKDAVDAAYRMAKKGETVLLSPCCASFDLFKSLRRPWRAVQGMCKKPVI